MENHLKEEDKEDKEEEFLYFDHAGATLPSKEQLTSYYNFLLNIQLCNPHSIGLHTKLMNQLIDKSRELVLNHFHLNSLNYSVIFTSNSTSSIKLISECFPWNKNSQLLYSYNSHTSILGLRELVSNVYCISSENIRNLSSPSSTSVSTSVCLNSENENNYSLLAIPGECNFSGSKFTPQNIINLLDNLSTPSFLQSDKLIQVKGDNQLNLQSSSSSSKWLWLLDASKLASTSVINIMDDYPPMYRPDFICCSFYKIFGFPTGIGALIVKNTTASLLNKRYFGGGTMIGMVADKDWSIPSKNIYTKFEDGTINYHGIIALKYGFDALTKAGGMSFIQQHTFNLCQYLYQQLNHLTHTPLENSNNLIKFCEIYGNHSYNDSTLQGSIFTFNIRWRDGTWVGFNEVGRLAVENNIQIRTGCFCCIGGCQEALKITANQVQQNISKGRSCQDTIGDVIDGNPTGAVRASVGYMTEIKDCDKFIEFLISNFLNKVPCTISSQSSLLLSSSLKLSSQLTINDNSNQEQLITATISSLYIYPIKSCAGIKVSKWPLASYGLYLDRKYAIQNSITGKTITIKSHSKLTLCIPYVDLNSDWMTIMAPNMPTILTMNYQSNEVILIPIENYINDENPFISHSNIHERVVNDILLKKSYYITNDNNNTNNLDISTISTNSIQICIHDINTTKISDLADSWFSDYLGIKCHLIIQTNNENENKNKNSDNLNESNNYKLKSFSNIGQFLMISLPSVKNLEDKDVIPESLNKNKESSSTKTEENTSKLIKKITEKSFRPNIVVNGTELNPHDEDNWKIIIVNATISNFNYNENSNNNFNEKTIQIEFLVTGPCARCTVININPDDGTKQPQRLKTLSTYRKDEKNNILFGQYLEYERNLQELLNNINIQDFRNSDCIFISESSLCYIIESNQVI